MARFVRHRLAARFFGKVWMCGKKSGHAIFVFLRLVGTCGVDKPSAGSDMRGGGGKDGVLLRHKALQPFLRPAPTRIRAATQHTRVGTGGIDQHTIKLAKRSRAIFGRADGFYPIKMETG